MNSEEAIDVVLIESYAGSGTMWNGKKQYKYTPFNPTDKYTIAFVEEEQSGKKYRLLKGAPQVCTEMCHAPFFSLSCSATQPCPAACIPTLAGDCCTVHTLLGLRKSCLDNSGNVGPEISFLQCLQHPALQMAQVPGPHTQSVPQVVLRKSANKDAISKRVEDTIVEFANRGYRALGVTRAEGGEGVSLLSFLALLCCCV